MCFPSFSDNDQRPLDINSTRTQHAAGDPGHGKKKEQQVRVFPICFFFLHARCASRMRKLGGISKWVSKKEYPQPLPLRGVGRGRMQALK